MRKLANNTFQLNLINSTMQSFQLDGSGSAFGKKLESRYMSKSFTNWLSLKKQLNARQMTELPNFMDPPDKFKRLVTELETIGGKIEDDKAILFLVSLPSSYEHVRTGLL